MRKLFTSAIAALALMAAPVFAEGHDQSFGGAIMGAGAISGGMSYSSVTNGNGIVGMESFSGARQTTTARFSESGTTLLVESFGSDAAFSRGLIEGEGYGMTEALVIRGGVAMGGSVFEGGLGDTVFGDDGWAGDDFGDDDEGGNCGNGRPNGNAQNCP
tara:strand:+ start:1834 stop:2310 length:477 start_codon:yes stop_codon:yes gene_type:complete